MTSPALDPRDAVEASALAYLNTKLAAEFLRLKPATLELYRIRGGGPLYRKHGRLVVYMRQDLVAWSDARVFGSTAEAKVGARRLRSRRPRKARRVAVEPCP